MADENLEIKSFDELFNLPVGTVVVLTAKHDSPVFKRFGQEKYVAIMAPNDGSVLLDFNKGGFMVAVNNPDRPGIIDETSCLRIVSGIFLSLTGKTVNYRIEKSSFNNFTIERLSPEKYVTFMLETFEIARQVRNLVKFPQRFLF